MVAKSLLTPLSTWNLTPDPSPQSSPISTSPLSLTPAKTRAMGSRPLSIVIPSGRPTLDEVLSNTAPFPFTLGAFMAYLSQNHCLETLEFTMEAKRYRESYRSAPSQQLITLWRRLISAYVEPGAPREINLSSDVRDALLAHANATKPPRPEVLDVAVRIMHDLMEESIFIHFLNSQSFGAQVPPPMNNPYAEERPRRLRRTSPRGKRTSSTGSREETVLNRMSGSARIAALVKTTSHLSEYSSSGDSGSPIFTDDSGSPIAGSPTGENLMTPPTTPPGSEHGYSPRNRSEHTWKKMGAKLGFKKRPGSSSSRDERWEE